MLQPILLSNLQESTIVHEVRFASRHHLLHFFHRGHVYLATFPDKVSSFSLCRQFLRLPLQCAALLAQTSRIRVNFRVWMCRPFSSLSGGLPWRRISIPNYFPQGPVWNWTWEFIPAGPSLELDLEINSSGAQFGIDFFWNCDYDSRSTPLGAAACPICWPAVDDAQCGQSTQHRGHGRGLGAVTPCAYLPDFNVCGECCWLIAPFRGDVLPSLRQGRSHATLASQCPTGSCVCCWCDVSSSL